MRSSCPINYSLETFGDQWSLLIIRDIVFNGKSTYGAFLQSAEGISTNILANRLAKLCAAGLIVKQTNPDDARTPIYRLTVKGRALVPVLLELILWGVDQGRSSEPLRDWARAIRADKDAAITKALASMDHTSSN